MQYSTKVIVSVSAAFGVFLIQGWLTCSAAPAIEEIASGLQGTSKSFLENADSFVISVLTQKIEPLVPEEKAFSSQIRTTLARKQNQWLAKAEILEDVSGNKNQVQQGDYPYFEFFLTKNGQVLQWTSNNSQCYIDTFVGSNIFLYWDYTRYLGLNIYKPAAESNGIQYETLLQKANDDPVYAVLNDLFIDETLVKNATKYKVASVTENIEGFPCWVVEWSGRDKMWIDIEHSFALRKRIIHFSPGGSIKYVVNNKEFQQVKQGLWLPHIQVVEEYADPKYKPKHLWGKPIRRVSYEVEKITFDQAADTSIFDIAVPAGTYVIDSVRKMDFVVAEEKLDPFAEPITLASQKFSYYKYRAITVVIVNVILLLLLWFFLSQPQKKKRNGKNGTPKPPSTKLIFLCVFFLGSGGYASEVVPNPNDTDEWKLAPVWRERGDCAVNSLYILLKIEGKKGVTLKKIKELVTIDSEQGSSFNALKDASHKLGWL